MLRVAILFLLGLSAIVYEAAGSSVYSYREKASSSDWVNVEVSAVVNETAHTEILQKYLPRPTKGKANLTSFVSQPVYVSMTTMHSRIHNIKNTIKYLLHGIVVPTKIYLFISKEPFLIDQGISVIPDELLFFTMMGYLNIVFVPNHGPHRKLLPILKEFRNEDVYIVTVDDDQPAEIVRGSIFHLLHTLKTSNYPDAVVALRARRMKICKDPPHKMSPYNDWPILQGKGKMEMLLMPTGNPAIMYKPQHFHEVVFSPVFRNITVTTDDIMFRLSTMMKNFPVLIGCGSFDNRCHANQVPVQRLLQALYDINAKGGNDASWAAALPFLQSYGFDFAKLTAAHAHERGEACYPPKGSPIPPECALHIC